jgi:hypothetical protein
MFFSFLTAAALRPHLHLPPRLASGGGLKHAHAIERLWLLFGGFAN